MEQRAEAFVQMTSNKFLLPLANDRIKEIGTVYSQEGLAAAYAHIEAKFLPSQQANRKRPIGSCCTCAPTECERILCPTHSPARSGLAKPIGGTGCRHGKKVRIDELLVTQGLADSRSQAKALVLAASALGHRAYRCPPHARSSALMAEQPPLCESGRRKLDGFDRFQIDVTGASARCRCLHRRVYRLLATRRSSRDCVDVGRAQPHNKLRQDERVTNPVTNARHLGGRLAQEDYLLIAWTCPSSP